MAEDMVLSVVIRAEDEASTAIAKIRNDLGELGISAGKGAGATDNALKKTGKSIKDFGKGLDDATKPLQKTAVGLAAVGTASVAMAVLFEDNFAKVKKTVEGTDEELERVRKGLLELSTTGGIRATTAELTELAAAGGQLGIDTENIVEFAKIMAQMGSATNLSGEAGAATLARLMNVTNTDQSKISNLGSAIVDLGNNFATTEAEIADMALRMGATGTIVGMSTQDILAYSTALSSLGIEAEAGGSAFSRILMSISTAVSSGGGELNAFAKTAGMTGKEFAKAWKNDATGTFKKFLEGLSKSKDVISKLEDLGFANIRDITGLQNLSGERGIELITEALERSNKAWEENTALEKEAAAMAQTTAGQIATAKQNIEAAGIALGEAFAPLVADASGKISELAQGFAAMDPEQIESIAGAIGAVVAVGTGVKVISGLATAIGALATPMGAVAVGAVAVTAAAVEIGLFVKEWKEYNADMERLAAEEAAIREEAAAERAQWNKELYELGDMESEIKELNLVINSDESSKEEIATAKARLEEIAAYLEREYGIKIETDNSELDATISKLETAINRRNELLSGKYRVANLTAVPQPTAGFAAYAPQAKGTQNFPGGLAMVNDETGISDPRELIIDRGRAFIPEGRNVLLPLSRGAKVYTAAQTKAIMSALGVPMYASGKDNSDGFIAARDALSHRKSTTAMSVSDELAEWVRLSEQFKSNQRDVWDIQEQIYSLTRKQTEELNEQSKAYIKERTALADWDSYGDDPMSAFNRVKERNLAEFSAGRMTWQEYTDTMSEFGELMLDERISQSEKWLDHERKYNDMSVEDYIAGLQRMQAYTLQYYEQGLIDLETYTATAAEINDNYLDAIEERNDNQYSAWEKSMDNWINVRDTYGDWDEFGDSLSQTYARAIARQDEFLAAGVINWQEAQDAKLEYSLEMYKAASDEYDAVLAEQQEYIDEMQRKFSEEEQALRDSWTIKDRSADLAEVEHLLSIYKNASTDAGQQKYKELLEQKEQLEREEQLYRLEQENNAVITKLQAEYDEMESNKKNVLARLKISSSDIADTNADISADVERTREIANEIGIKYTAAANSTLNSLGEVVSLLEGIKKVLGSKSTNTYNDYKTISIAGGMSESAISKVVNGTVVTTLGSIMFNG